MTWLGAAAPATARRAPGSAVAALYYLARGLLTRSRAGLALLGLTLALAALLVSAGAHVWRGAPAAYERLHALSGAPHAWFALPGHPLGDVVADAIGADPAVAGETFRLPMAALTLRTERDGAARTVDVRVYGLETAGGGAGGTGPVGPVPGFLLTAGRWPVAGAEAAVDQSLADVLGLAMGDTVQVLGHDGPVAVRIVGQAASAMHCPYPECVLPPLLVPGDLFSSLVRQPNMLLGVRLHQPDEAAAFAFATRRRAAELGLPLDAGNWLDVLAHQRLSHSLTASFFVLAGALALAAGAAVTSHVVAAAAIAGRRVMGLARAVGYTPRQVMSAFALGCGAVGALAAAAGAPGGAVLARGWIAGAWSVPGSGPWLPGVIVVAVAAAAAALGAWAARGAAVGGTLPVMGAAGGGVPVRLRPGLPGVPQLFVIRPARPAVPAVSVAISMAMAVGAATLAHTMAAFGQDPAQVGVYHQLVVERSGLPAEDVDALLRTTPGVGGFHREAWVRVDVPGAATSIVVRALDGDWQSLPWRVVDGGFMARPGEIALGTGAMERLGARPGDVIDVAVGLRRDRWRVTGSYLDLTNAGLVGAVAWDTLAEVDPGLQPAAWLVRLAPEADAEAVRERLLAATDHQIRVSRAGFEPPAPVRTAWRLVDGLALLLGGLAVVAVVQAMAATVREQRRDIAILKAIGMTPAQLVAGTLAGIGAAAAAGAAAGTILGVGLTWTGFAAAGAVSGVGGFSPAFPWSRLVLLMAAAPPAAALAALPPAAAAARAPAAESGGEN